ncbi:hypothetical protein GP486_002884 [Trichoglossum hirsutum]|uniref:SGNH hydrolase-type esterase domain-containing protein n=1 Tax=Trichoglossum hirsutum TaxID=265104 RepID=A0A9P8RRB0_9PEZI|nr:hypothetical protein GP486_002884 [Trichoglossum hirsutum]
MVGLRIASIIPLFVGSAFCGLITARQGPGTQGATPLWPISYIALGDSFAAGIGAGHYIDRNNDEVKRCKRFDGSYPWQAKHMFFYLDDEAFNFEACSGDVLAGIDNQVANLGGNRAQAITLSISGNDFNFGDVVRSCIYSLKPLDINKDSDCQRALQGAREKIQDNRIWDSYKAKVNDILQKVAITTRYSGLDWSVLVITGYAKFFGPVSAGDPCSSFRFPLPVPGFQGNLLHPDVRTEMNSLVDMVNRQISSQIVGVNTNLIRFVNIDDHFEGHRFCDRGKTDGANDPDVWFISFDTTLEETEFTPNPNSSLEQGWDAWAQAIPNGGNGVLPGALRRSSVFHPKAAGHLQTAKKVQTTVTNWGNDHGHRPDPSSLSCNPAEAGDLSGLFIAASRPNEAVDVTNVLFKLRDVLCNNACRLPDRMYPQAGTAVSGDNGRCDIYVALEGGSQAYAIRDRSISGDAQAQHCWGTLQKIISDCIKGGAKRGAMSGVDPTPAMYQAGLVKINAFSPNQPQLSQENALEKDLSGFHGVCGNGDGPCDGNGCNGVWYICSEGQYKGTASLLYLLLRLIGSHGSTRSATM